MFADDIFSNVPTATYHDDADAPLAAVDPDLLRAVLVALASERPTATLRDLGFRSLPSGSRGADADLRAAALLADAEHAHGDPDLRWCPTCAERGRRRAVHLDDALLRHLPHAEVADVVAHVPAQHQDRVRRLLRNVARPEDVAPGCNTCNREDADQRRHLGR